VWALCSKIDGRPIVGLPSDAKYAGFGVAEWKPIFVIGDARINPAGKRMTLGPTCLIVYCTLLVQGCSTLRHIRFDSEAHTPSAARLREWMGDECVSAGKFVGIDYAHSLELAIRADPAGLAELFRFTETEGFVGAAAENHCGILIGLLRRWGDGRFAAVLRSQSLRIRQAVIDAIEYASSYPGWKPNQFPQTYSSAPHENVPRWTKEKPVPQE
jgi:hypothetical protein